MNHLSRSESDTEEIARNFASHIVAGDVIFLSGPLGAGKSVFARALIRTLTGDRDLEVPSPTFTLIQSYDSARGSIYHFDLYRIQNPDDVVELGWDEALGGITLVEWAERLGPYCPQNFTDIAISTVPEDTACRIIKIQKSCDDK